MTIAARAGLKAFSNRREQRNSHIRHPAHFEASAVTGIPSERVETVSDEHIYVNDNMTLSATCQANDTRGTLVMVYHDIF